MPLVIFVDDNEDEGYLFQKAINEISNQCIVSYAKGGLDFFEMLDKVTPEYIFLDIKMPDEDGISCLKKIRAQEEYDSIPVVMYSDYDSRIEECFLEKATYFIKKPKTYSGILAALKQVISQNKYTKPSREQFLIQ